jgi:hypothetical protein
MAGKDLGDNPRRWHEWLVEQGYLQPDEYNINLALESMGRRKTESHDSG